MTSDTVHYIVHGVIRRADADAIRHRTPAPDAGSVALPGAASPAVIEADKLASIVSPIDTAAAPTLFDDAERVKAIALAHNQTLVDAIEAIDVAPVRLGAVHSSETAVQTFLSREAAFFTSILDAIENAVEYCIEVRPAETPAPGAAPTNAPKTGRDYLRARSASKRGVSNQRQSVKAFADAAAERLTHVCKDLIISNDAPRLTLSALVERGPSPDFVQEIEALAEASGASAAALHVTGPWPTYSFASHERPV